MSGPDPQAGAMGRDLRARRVLSVECPVNRVRVLCPSCVRLRLCLHLAIDLRDIPIVCPCRRTVWLFCSLLALLPHLPPPFPLPPRHALSPPCLHLSPPIAACVC